MSCGGCEESAAWSRSRRGASVGPPGLVLRIFRGLVCANVILVAVGPACGRIGYELRTDLGVSDEESGQSSETEPARESTPPDIATETPSPDVEEPPLSLPPTSEPPTSEPDSETELTCDCPLQGNLIAEWYADGDTSNQVACSPWQAETRGDVPYGDGRQGQAWHFRSTDISGDSPNYVDVTACEPVALGHVTVDAWVRQQGFNDYDGSNRMIFSTSDRSFEVMQPHEFALYLHAMNRYFFFMKVGQDFERTVDWETCFFQGVPESPAGWLRLTATYDGNELRCFANGSPTSIAIPLPTQGLGVPDVQPRLGWNYPGDVDAVRVFNVALTPAEIAATWP